MRKQEIQFQKDSPYQQYAQRHVNIHKKNNILLIALVIPAMLYLTTRMDIFMVLGAVQLAGTLAYGKREERTLLNEYTEMERQTLEKLNRALDETGFSADRLYSFGYIRTEERFDPVFLVKDKDKLHVYENIFLKNCIYGLSGQMLYILDLDRSRLKQELDCQALSDLQWSVSETKHQMMLREEGIRLNRYLVIENVIYERILKDMMAGKRKSFLNMNYVLTEIRKETVYRAELSEGHTLLLPASVEQILKLVN